jgi:hypothetical protein
VDTPSEQPPTDDLVPRVAEVSLRMMADAIPRRTQDDVRALMASHSEEYPWQRVVDVVLRDAVAADDLISKGLRAQRDWFNRGTVAPAPRAVRAARVAGKRALAYVLSRAIFFVLYTLAVVVLLVVLKQRWPEVDIYRLLDWLRDVLPNVFRR